MEKNLPSSGPLINEEADEMLDPGVSIC